MAITCQCPNKCEIHPKYDNVATIPRGKGAFHEGTGSDLGMGSAVTSVPQIDAADKLQLKVLEAESLKAQIEMEQARQRAVLRAQQAYQQLEQFSAVIYEKHGLKQSEWILDLVKLEFVRREQPQQGIGAQRG